MANGEKRKKELSIGPSVFTPSRGQHAAANQRFHMPYVLAADLLGDRPDAGCARHRVTSEKQMIAGADQAGVEQHRIDGAELAASDALGEQAAVEIQQRRDKEF